MKTFGLADRIRVALEGVEGIQVAFIFGSVARNEDTATSDVDVMVIGTCGYNEVVLALHAVGKQLRRMINPAVYLADEFVSMIVVNGPFALNVLDSPRISLIGDLGSMAPGAPHPLLRANVIADRDMDMPKRISQEIKADFPGVDVYLFGSRAWGHPTADSDYDILVIADDSLFEDKKLVTRLRCAARRALQMESLDLLAARRSSAERPRGFLEQIIKEGIRL